MVKLFRDHYTWSLSLSMYIYVVRCNVSCLYNGHKHIAGSIHLIIIYVYVTVEVPYRKGLGRSGEFRYKTEPIHSITFPK